MLAAMKPSFNRFPGGCYVEGNRLPNAFRWKNSIGDLAQRPGHWNLWGYRSTDGLGYHEYLQLCEDIGAEPLFVINCGMAHEDHVPNDKLRPLDRKTPWTPSNMPTARPTAAGDRSAPRRDIPAPFHLKYMEIGNENGGPVYEDHYRQFYDAIKAKYPEMILVANTPVKSRPMDILDEHYYDSPEFFMRNATRYDAYDRKTSPKIYVGEYAVTQNCGKGNLRAAVGEAAFMTGMERNSDIVVMASYAPLVRQLRLAAMEPQRHQFRQFAGLRHAFLPRTEDVQRESRQRRPGARFQGPHGQRSACGRGRRRRRLGHPGRVQRHQGRPGRQSALPVRFLQGSWRLADEPGALASQGRGLAADGARGRRPGHLRRQVMERLHAHAQGPQAGRRRRLLDPLQRARRQCQGLVEHRRLGQRAACAWKWMGIGPAVDGRIETGRWYDIKVENIGNRIRCYLDGKLVHDARRGELDSMYAVASRAKHNGDVILKVVNAAADAAGRADFARRA